MKEYIEIECGYCGHTEDILADIEQNDEFEYDHVVVDCSHVYGVPCPVCGEEGLQPTGYGGPSDHSERQSERSQMGLSNF